MLKLSGKFHFSSLSLHMLLGFVIFINAKSFINFIQSCGAFRSIKTYSNLRMYHQGGFLHQHCQCYDENFPSFILKDDLMYKSLCKSWVLQRSARFLSSVAWSPAMYWTYYLVTCLLTKLFIMMLHYQLELSFYNLVLLSIEFTSDRCTQQSISINRQYVPMKFTIDSSRVLKCYDSNSNLSLSHQLQSRAILTYSVENLKVAFISILTFV